MCAARGSHFQQQNLCLSPPLLSTGFFALCFSLAPAAQPPNACSTRIILNMGPISFFYFIYYEVKLFWLRLSFVGIVFRERSSTFFIFFSYVYSHETQRFFLCFLMKNKCCRVSAGVVVRVAPRSTVPFLASSPPFSPPSVFLGLLT